MVNLVNIYSLIFQMISKYYLTRRSIYSLNQHIFISWDIIYFSNIFINWKTRFLKLLQTSNFSERMNYENDKIKRCFLCVNLIMFSWKKLWIITNFFFLISLELIKWPKQQSNRYNETHSNEKWTEMSCCVGKFKSSFV